MDLHATTFQLFIACSLFTLAAAVLVAGRRNPHGVALAIFLALVGANFATYSLGRLTGEPRWDNAGVLTLALDPVYLLAFVTLYPYRRRPPPVRALLAGAAGVAAVGVGIAVLGGPEVVSARNPWHGGLIAAMAVAYASAWFLSLRSVAQAPTPLLARRSAWMVGAVGVAVVPRLGLLPDDFGVRGNDLAEQVLLAGGIALMVALLLAGWGLAAQARSARLRRPFLLVGAAMVLVTLARLDTWARFSGANLGFAYGLRWLVFAGILAYGILADEVVELRRPSDHLIPLIGGMFGGTACFFGLLGWPGLLAGTSLVAGAGFGALGGVGSWLAVRAVVHKLERQAPAPAEPDRRLTLYQAALESAWARGPPSKDARAALEADRKAFGVSHDESRALEHAVAARMAGGERLRPGDEAATGLVLEEMLGEGAHGRVFSATRYPSGERVVVKELHPDQVGGHEARHRLLREVRALQRLEHPGIVRLLDAKFTGGRHMLVMEHVDGRSLADALAKGPLPAPRVRALAVAMLDALAAAHAQGVVHGDLKPANILLARDGSVRITDFGIAHVDGREEAVKATISRLDGQPEFQGTLAYMAPEQVRGGKVSPATDLYASGLVLHEALTGNRAIDLQGRNLYDAIAVVGGARVDVEPAPAAWRPMLRRALAHDPGERFPSAAEMRKALPPG